MLRALSRAVVSRPQALVGRTAPVVRVGMVLRARFSNPSKDSGSSNSKEFDEILDYFKNDPELAAHGFKPEDFDHRDITKLAPKAREFLNQITQSDARKFLGDIDVNSVLVDDEMKADFAELLQTLNGESETSDLSDEEPAFSLEAVKERDEELLEAQKEAQEEGEEVGEELMQEKPILLNLTPENLPEKRLEFEAFEKQVQAEKEQYLKDRKRWKEEASPAVINKFFYEYPERAHTDPHFKWPRIQPAYVPSVQSTHRNVLHAMRIMLARHYLHGGELWKKPYADRLYRDIRKRYDYRITEEEWKDADEDAPTPAELNNMMEEHIDRLICMAPNWTTGQKEAMTKGLGKVYRKVFKKSDKTFDSLTLPVAPGNPRSII